MISKALSQCQQGIWCNKEPGDTIGFRNQFVYRRNRNWCFSKVRNVKIKIPIQECEEQRQDPEQWRRSKIK